MHYEEEIEITGQVVDVKLIPYEDVEEIESETEIPTPPSPKKRKSKNSCPTPKGPVGRKLQDVWNEFEVTLLGPGKKMTVCRHCSQKTSDGARAYRLREHLMKCDQYLDNVGEACTSGVSTKKAKLKRDRAMSLKQPPRPLINHKLEDVKIFGRKSSAEKVTSAATGWRNGNKDVISAEKEKISRHLARFLISARIPFNIVNNDEFRGFIKILRPDYTLPPQEKLSGLVFETVYNELRAETDRGLRGEKVVLIQSGWSNSSTSVKRLITHALRQGPKVYFFNAVEVSSLEVSALLCETLIREAIFLAEMDFGCKIIGVVTDNISNFLEVKSLLEAFNPCLYVNASHLHLLLYVGHSFIDDEILDKIVKVYKYFRSYDYQCDRMMEEINRSPETRWNNDQNALVAFIRDREKYLEILTDPQYHSLFASGRVQLTEPVIQIERKTNSIEEAEFLEILNDPNLNQKADEMMAILKPLQISLEVLQKEGCSLADGVSCWLSWIKNNVVDNEQIYGMVDQYKKIAINPPGITAYMLNPKYKGVLLSEEEVESGREYILSINLDFLDPVVAFMQSDDTMYPKSLIKEASCLRMDPIRWWKEQIRNTKLPSGFVQFALSLISLPANVNSLERCFSS